MLPAIRHRLGLPSPPSATARPRWFLFPFELYTLGVLAASFVYLRGSGLRFDWVTLEYTLGPMLRRLPASLALGIGLQLTFHLLARRSWRDYLGRVLSLPWLLLWLRIYAACLLWNYIYFWLKVYVPLLNGQLWDHQLWELDATLHLGVSPSVFLVEALKGSWALSWLDRWYGVWITTIYGAVCFFSADPRDDVRRSFTLACVALWTTGAVLYVAVPALGPIYVFTELWAPLRSQLPSADAGQAVLWENYQKLLALRQSGIWTSFNPTRGIAAMPSLHVGGHFLLALWSRRTLGRPFALACGIATLLTFLGSLATGWHYAIDGYVAILLAWLATRLALVLEPVATPPAGGSAPPVAASPAESAV